jgi:hypothetical protein
VTPSIDQRRLASPSPCHDQPGQAGRWFIVHGAWDVRRTCTAHCPGTCELLQTWGSRDQTGPQRAPLPRERLSSLPAAVHPVQCVMQATRLWLAHTPGFLLQRSLTRLIMKPTPRHLACTKTRYRIISWQRPTHQSRGRCSPGSGSVGCLSQRLCLPPDATTRQALVLTAIETTNAARTSFVTAESSAPSCMIDAARARHRRCSLMRSWSTRSEPPFKMLMRA